MCNTPVTHLGTTYAFFKNTIILFVLTVYNGFQIPPSRTPLVSLFYFGLISRLALALLAVCFLTGSSIY